MELLRRRHQNTNQAAREEPRPLQMPAVPELSVPTQEGPAHVQVIYGASVQNMPVAGLTVAQAREIAVAVLQVDRRASVLLNGQPVDGGHVIQASDTLEYVHFAGEKGRADQN